MAAIGTIRKHGVLLMVIIGVALLAFLLGDFNQLTSLFSNKNTIAKIDGVKVDNDYRILFEQNSLLWKIFYEKTSLDESETYQVHEMTWQQLLEEKIVDKQLAALGLSFNEERVEEVKEAMIASLSTQNPNQLLGRMIQYYMQRGADPQQLIALLSSIEEHANEENFREFYNAYKAIEKMEVLEQKKNAYFTVANAATLFSTPLAKQLNADNKSAMVQLLTLNPNSPAFKDIKGDVTENDMKKWFDENKKRYIIKQNMRDIDVAIFQVVPSAVDKQTIQDSVRSQYNRFLATTSIEEFNLNESFDPFDSTYYVKDDFKNIDTVGSAFFSCAAGAFVEPINVQDMIWYYGRCLSVSARPDSVQVAFLVFDYKTDRNPNSTRTKAQAQKEKDSVYAALTSGQANVFQLTAKYSGGRDAADSTMWLAERGTYKKLYDNLLKTPQFGLYNDDVPGAFVIYQLLSTTRPIEKRQIAFYSKPIEPSSTTIKDIRSQANHLMASSKTADELLENANKSGIQVMNGTDVTAMSATISQLPNCRDIVNWAFSKETKKDAVSDVFDINNSAMFAVAAVRSIKEKGTPKFEDVKAVIEQELIQKSKLQKIETLVNDMLKKGTPMQEIGAKYQSPLADSVMLVWAGDVYQNRNVENKAIGKIFSLNVNKPTAVSADNFVYAVSIYNFDKPAPASPNYNTEKMMLRNIMMGRNRTSYTIIQGLKDQIDIFDQRSKFYEK